jgi:hypothetical protein
MTRHRRLAAAVLICLPTLALASGPARADHCAPRENPKPIPGYNTTYCHTPEPTAKPKTPTPTTAPTAAPSTPAPTRAPVTDGGGSTRTSSPARNNTPEPTPFDIEVPEDEDALATPEIIVDGIDDPGEAFDVEDPAEGAASASTWIFGFIVGFIIGGLFGRASWGMRRRRKQQIFG